jgi:hypothetical protein
MQKFRSERLLGGERYAQVLDMLSSTAKFSLPKHPILKEARLPFYQDYTLIEISQEDAVSEEEAAIPDGITTTIADAPRSPLSLCYDPSFETSAAQREEASSVQPAPERLALGKPKAVFLDGSGRPIIYINQYAKFRISRLTVKDYARFYISQMRGKEGPFAIVEGPEDIPDLSSVAVDVRRNVEEMLHAKPFTYAGHYESDFYTLMCMILYGRTICSAKFIVPPYKVTASIDGTRRTFFPGEVYMLEQDVPLDMASS